MPFTQYASSLFTSIRRTKVVQPTTMTSGRSRSANVWNGAPNDVDCATKASATMAPERRVRNIEARLNDSLHDRERVARRLQCSVARIWMRCDRRAISSEPDLAAVSEDRSVVAIGPGIRSIDMVT